MKVLLDTHLLLWATGCPDRISEAGLRILRDPVNELMFSAVSLWEVSIKLTLGRTDFSIEPRRLRRGLLDHGYEELPILGEHAVSVTSLPPIHKDPFDRMLVAQSMVEGVLLLTSDPIVAQYPGPVRLV